MPTFVVHELGREGEAKVIERDEIRIGRDKASELVLKNVSVSRKHAVVRKAEDGSWLVEGLSVGNPVMVNGKPTEGPTPITEGAEIQVGRFYLVFSEKDVVPLEYMGKSGFKYPTKCEACGFEQEVSALDSEPKCKKCESAALPPPAALGVGIGSKGASVPETEGATTALDTRALLNFHKKLRLAARAQVVHLDPETGKAGARQTLMQTKACTFGKPGHTTIAVEGFVLGVPAEIAWDEEAWVVRKTSLFPPVLVNGEKVRKRTLEPGDEVRIGKSAYRFIVA